MRNKIIVFMLAALMLSGCGSREPKQYDNRMKDGGSDMYSQILIDKETGVCYLRTNYGGVTVMVNQDGTPYIANGWRDNGT